MFKLALGVVFLVFLGQHRISGTLYGHPVSVSMLLIVFVAVATVAAIAAVLLVRAIVRELALARAYR